MIKIRWKTNVGRVRSQNEDTIRVETNKLDHKILIVADGMGGHNAGDVASQMASKIIGDEFLKLGHKIDYKAFIQFVILKANKDIYLKSLIKKEYSKMGTTISLLIYDGEKIYIGHVGDSRIYFISEKKIMQITKDHTFVEAMVESGKMTREIAEKSKYRNILLQALGTSKKITIEIKEIKLPKYYSLLLCSDGLTGKVSNERIMNIINQTNQIDEKVEKLIQTANNLDGRDNVSVILMENRR